jgi:tripeptidyl-peptidase-1
MIGSNPGCNTIGFSAVPGYVPCHGNIHSLLTDNSWDPVTGLGTPNFPKMLEYYLGLP